MKKKILIGLLVVLVVIQFIRPSRNNGSLETGKDISQLGPVPENVMNSLKTSCYDCHSNKTVYPWYANIQPVAWWLNNHIVEGKDELNFSEFTPYSPRRQYHKLEEVAEVLQENEMPLTSYTLIHRNAILSEEQKAAMTQWAESIKDTLESHYPMDSLLIKRRG